MRTTGPRGTKRLYVPPLSNIELARLRADAADIRATAERKNIPLADVNVALEAKRAREHFALGCWLFYYRPRIGAPDALEARIDCARRLFEAGFVNPHYDFRTVFDFTEPDFDTLFESGDRDDVVAGLREIAARWGNPNLLRAFREHGWSLTDQRQHALPL